MVYTLKGAKRLKIRSCSLIRMSPKGSCVEGVVPSWWCCGCVCSLHLQTTRQGSLARGTVSGGTCLRWVCVSPAPSFCLSTSMGRQFCLITPLHYDALPHHRLQKLGPSDQGEKPLRRSQKDPFKLCLCLCVCQRGSANVSVANFLRKRAA